MFSAEVSGSFLEPGTNFLVPFGQKECRSAGDVSRLFFSWKLDQKVEVGKFNLEAQ